jgi:hypothetical protein
MRAGFIITVVATLITSAAFAQSTTPQAPDRPSASSPSAGPAVRPPEGKAANGPVAGANSFTEAEVKARIESQGFANVTDLKKMDDGIWLGMAQREGQSFQVALDHRGNVFFRPPS